MYAKDVEVYTLHGWKLLKDIKVGSSVFTMDISTFKPDYIGVTRTYEQNKDTLINFYGESVDLAMTGNQEVLYGYERYPLHFVRAEYLLNVLAKLGAFFKSDPPNGLNQFDYPLKDLLIEEVEYNDLAYNIELLDSSNPMLVRRNNKHIWTGGAK